MREHNTLDRRYGYNLVEELGLGAFHLSEETKKKISDANSGEKHYHFGKRFVRGRWLKILPSERDEEKLRFWQNSLEDG